MQPRIIKKRFKDGPDRPKLFPNGDKPRRIAQDQVELARDVPESNKCANMALSGTILTSILEGFGFPYSTKMQYW